MEPIAIIGIGCRFPSADGPAAFWRLLRDGVDAIGEVPADRWDVDAYYDADPAVPGKMISRWGGFLEQVDRFDPAFFKISRREAMHVDPQQRLLLEVAWEALEDAGLAADPLAGTNVGVFVGICGDDYSRMQLSRPGEIDAYTNSGSFFCIAANRISYAFDLRGPSMAIDTACSGSLVAVHLACQSLRSGESSLALAGGVNLMLLPEPTIGFSKLAAMSPDGRCKAFDARGNGYVRGEGAGVVVLKPLGRALADGDPIYAVVRGSAVNQDGRTNGLTAPNRWAQEAVLREAYRSAGVDPRRVQYVEAHGTGTLLGDPIEARALGAVLGKGRPAGQPCAIGSVKTNVGHLEPAAGIAGLIKAALMLRHRALPPSLHFETPNPHIPFAELGLQVQRELQPWPDTAEPIVAGVSSFSFGGTNAHIVLEGAPEAPNPPVSAEPVAVVLPISAHTPAALRELAGAYRDALLDGELRDTPLRDIVYTAGARRSHHAERLALIGRSHAELAGQLEAFLAGETRAGVTAGNARGARRKLVFVCSGHGSQWLGMGRALAEASPVFRASLEATAEAMAPYLALPLLSVLEHDALAQVELIQPAIFAIQVALAALLDSAGVTPAALIGHSMGEITAAHLAGVLSLPAAARLICQRGQLLAKAAGHGAMAMVELTPAEAEAALGAEAGEVVVALNNSPRSCVLAGAPEAVARVVTRLEAAGVFVRRVHSDVAFHSPQMQPLAAELVAGQAGLEPAAGTLPLYSTVDGALRPGAQWDASYWGHNLREPVRFADAMVAAIADGHTRFVELAPHPVLRVAIEQCLAGAGVSGVALDTMRRGDERGALLGTLGALYSQGVSVDWAAVQGQGRVVPLPRFPWQRERLWLEETPSPVARPAQTTQARPAGQHPLLGQRWSSSAQPNSAVWEQTLSIPLMPFLADHCLDGVAVVPATAYLELATAAAQATFGSSAALAEVAFQQVLLLRGDEAHTVQVVFADATDTDASFTIASRAAGAAHTEPWTQHAAGRVRIGEMPAEAATAPVLEQTRARCADELGGDAFYSYVRQFGFEYGPAFQGVERAWFGAGEALAQLTHPDTLRDEAAGYYAHPALLDACFQLLATASLRQNERGGGEHYLPVALEWLEIGAAAGPARWAYTRLHEDADGALAGDTLLLDAEGRPLASAYGLRMRRLEGDRKPVAQAELDGWLYETSWEPQPLPADSGESRPEASWLICADREGVGQALAGMLAARGQRCVLVFPGALYTMIDRDVYHLNPEAPDAFRQLLHDAFGDDQPPCAGVIHLWALGSQSPDAGPVALSAAQSLGSVGALHLAQALAQTGWRNTPRLWLVSAGAQPVGHAVQPAGVAGAPLWGLGRSIGYEHPRMRCSRVDLGAGSARAETAALFRELWTDGDEEEIALRDGQRFVARLARAAPQPARPPIADETLFRPDGTYLITGGLGGLGMTVARWMLERGARHLALLGRSRPSDEARGLLETLHRADVQIMVVQADVADAQQLDAALDQIRAAMPPLRGVFHAAGRVDDATLLRLDKQRLRAVLAPKVEGAWHLHRLTLNDPLEQFVCFSSAAALLGSPGQANYAAANAFLDALAHHRHGLGLPALSINWGPWAEIGLAAQPERGGRLASQGIASIPVERGLAALGQLLTEARTQVGVLPLNLRQWQQFYPHTTTSPLFARLAGEQPGETDRPANTALREALLAAGSETRRQQLMATYLREQVAQIVALAPAQVDEHTPFNALGFDSLMAMDLRNRLEASLGLVLSATLVWTYPNIAALATFLRGKVEGQPAPQHAAAEPQPVAEPEVPGNIEDLSRDELARLLAQELENIDLLT